MKTSLKIRALTFIAISHPHYYAGMVDWARACYCPVHLHADDREWITRDDPHIELNAHILIPLQDVASLHFSSRSDAPEPDWPPHGFADGPEDDERR